MQVTTEPVYTASSPPLILDSDMLGPLDADPDFEFFDSSALEDEFTDTQSHFTASLGPPGPGNHKSSLRDESGSLATKSRPTISMPSTASPIESYHDSSSESSRYKRKSSSDSSRSALTTGDVMMADDTEILDWKHGGMVNVESERQDPLDEFINPSMMNDDFGGFNDKTMENDFDFESAASSPSLFDTKVTGIGSPEMTITKTDAPKKYAPMPKKLKQHNKAPSQHSVTQSMNALTTAGSREVSPLSAMTTGQESSPSAFLNQSPSPTIGREMLNGSVLGRISQGAGWAMGLDPTNIRLSVPSKAKMTPKTSQLGPFGMVYPKEFSLLLHPTPLKSRVETQIPIKMSLYPLPPGITKLHLPTYTISKPKLLAKPTPERSPDTLELFITLVCTSAMQNPELKKRAFERAALAARPTGNLKEESSDSGSEEDEESKPINGGEVKICAGCVIRERKRAARKKAKKVEEEESWQKYETQRVIVFNTQEMKEWQTPTSQPSTEINGDRPEPQIPDGAMQVDAPMRIACYCRHQNEKLGFQVIFTIKDYQDRLIAQEMTSSIMITDDHKTHNIPSLPTQTSNGSDTPMFPGAGQFSTETFDMTYTPAGNLAPFRVSQSSSDLQALQQNPNLQFQPPAVVGASGHGPQAVPASMTPRGLSRQASPSGSGMPASKKRKASGSTKVPSGLAMTRLETGENVLGPAGPVNMSSNTSAVQSPFNPHFPAFSLNREQQFGPTTPNMAGLPAQFNTGPPTPNSNDQVPFSNANRSQSMDNLAMQQLYSAPGSAMPSRVSSPSGSRNPQAAYQQQQQAQIAQAVANGMYGLPLSLNPHRPPIIHKLIPNEGPKAGGIEVTCLGSGFCQGLEVMFGECKATTTTFWGETSLVCLLPPSVFAGVVPVTFKHQHQQSHMQPYSTPPMPNQQALFKYVDDDELQILRTALSVLGHKMTGKMEDVRDLARRIVGDGSTSWGASSQTPSGGGQVNPGFNAAAFGVDVEATLLKCLDLMDLDDSPNLPRYNMRRASGQTMLHLACSLGLHRFVAALLVRGANPEPRDKGGYTPMHFAALHNHPHIIRRLMLSGADPTMRSLQGFTPADMSKSREVKQATRRIEHHSRTRSGGSLRSRTSSATSLRSVWECAAAPGWAEDDSGNNSEDANDYVDEDADAPDEGVFWMPPRHSKSRRASAQHLHSAKMANDEVDPVLDRSSESPSLTAATSAWLDQITTQIQQLQHTMHLNLPQMPRFDMPTRMPTLPDYQAYLPTTPPMVRRITNLVNHSRPSSPKEHDYRWWDLFSGTIPSAPPAYDEIFPQGDVDTKLASATQAATDTVADNKCAEMFDQTEVGAETSATAALKAPVRLSKVRIGQGQVVTREQQDQLRLAHAEKVKRLSRDRNLFFIWIPLLLIVILAMLYNRVPAVWSFSQQCLDLMRHFGVPEERFVEVV